MADTQSTYVTVAADGLLVGGGGHLHNGGRETLLSDDRGRGLCRSTPRLGAAPMGHQNGQTVVSQGAPPPEVYADDPPILGISTCRINERVRRGERLRFDATYLNDRPRAGVMGIFSFYVWEGGGPTDPVRR